MNMYYFIFDFFFFYYRIGDNFDEIKEMVVFIFEYFFVFYVDFFILGFLLLLIIVDNYWFCYLFKIIV